MFKFIKKILDKRSHKQKILDAIGEQQLLLESNNQFNSEDEFIQEIVINNKDQILLNIDDLIHVYCSLLVPLKNKIIEDRKEMIDLISYPIPKSIKGFCVYYSGHLSNLGTPKISEIMHLDFKNIETKDSHKYNRLKLKISYFDGFTPKFKKLYQKKLREKLTNSIRLLDNGSGESLSRLLISTDKMLQFLEFYGICSVYGTIMSTDLPIIVIQNGDNELNTFLSMANNLNCVLILDHKVDFDGYH